MPIRKNRTPGQGVTNSSSLTLLKTKSSMDIGLRQSFKNTNHSVDKSLNLSQAQSIFDIPKNTMTEHHPFYYSGMKSQNSPFCQSDQKPTFLPKKNYTTKFQKSQQQPQLSTNAANVLEKIRKTYKYNAHVRKIAKAWGFDNKGYISNEKFQQIVQEHFSSQITAQHCNEMLRSVGNNYENVDLMSFIKLVFDQQPFTKPDINVLGYERCEKSNQKKIPAQTLIGKITNLYEGSIVHEDNGQWRASGRTFETPQMDEDNKQNASYSQAYDSKLGSYGMGKTQPSLYQTLHSASSPKFTFSTTKSHTVQFTPTLFQGINQQKTRFSANPPILLNDQSLPQNKRDRIFDSKMRVLSDLAQQRKTEKIRYNNKLQLIRQHREKEKESILEIDRKAEQRNRLNMRKYRQQNLAYNYVNFIHNQWK